MKLRIIQRGDGKFIVQRKPNFLTGWLDCLPNYEDYPGRVSDKSYPYQDYLQCAYSTLELARKKYEKEKQEIIKFYEQKKISKLNKHFKTILEEEI